jgi:hypothetical protein
LYATDTGKLYVGDGATAGGVLVSGAGSSVGGFLKLGARTVLTSTTARWLHPTSGTRPATVGELRHTIAKAGTLGNLFIFHNAVGVGGATLTYTVHINGVASALLVAMLATAAAGSESVTTVAVVAGDEVSIKVDKSAALTSSPTTIVATLEVN